MLLEINITNYRSICETQTLNMVASNDSNHKNNIFDSGINGFPKLVASTAMYGPNASGKSNFIKALSFMRSYIISSSKDKQEGDRIDIQPFKFTKEKKILPSEFETIFIKYGVRYQYGFSVTPKRVVGEWLIAYPEGRPQKWYERQFDFNEGRENWYFGPKFQGSRNLWKKSTRDNALFLSTAIQLNSTQLKPVFEWFRDLRVIPDDTMIAPGYTISQCEDDENKKRIINFLNAADLSISDIVVKKEKFTSDLLPNDMPQNIAKQIIDDLKDEDVIGVKLLHPSSCGSELVPIDLDEESAGTQKLFQLAGPWLNLLEDGLTVFVDELDQSMHPLMVRFLVGLLHNPQYNKNKAQLIFTTHDTSILDKDFLRRDQIWFFEKNRDNSTHIYPLTDFSPRNNEALEKGYLQGRYGALPFLGGVEF